MTIARVRGDVCHTVPVGRKKSVNLSLICLQIDQLEKEQIEYQKHMKAVQWAKMELQSATSANTRWKELCDQLQLQTEDASTANLMRERELYHTIAERNQQIVSLRVAQVMIQSLCT